MNDAKASGYKSPEPDEAVHSEMFAVSEPSMVTVRMFDREYQIQSDQPQLVELLVDEINREAKKLKDASSIKMGPGHFDWPVQVAFQLALGRFKALEAYNTLKRQVETEADKMTKHIDTGLQEIEKIPQAIEADLDNFELANSNFYPPTETGLDDQETEKLARRITADLDDLDTEKLAARVSIEFDQLELDTEEIVRQLMATNFEDQK